MDFKFNTLKVVETAPTEIKKVSFTEDDLTILCYIEQYFWENDGEFPSQEIIVDTLKFSTEQVRKTFDRPRFREALIARGIVIDRRADGVLTPVQLSLSNALLNVDDKRTIRQKLKDLNITVTQYNNWLQDPAFQNYMRKRSEHVFKITDGGAYRALAEQAESGDVQALKLFFEMRGLYSPRMNINLNVEGIIVQVVEIITKHVHDSEILDAIAADIDTLELKGLNAAS